MTAAREIIQNRRNYLADLCADPNAEITETEWAEITKILSSQCPTYRPAPAGMYSQREGVCLNCGRDRH